MDLLFDWNNEGDRFSFDDSENFEEESVCSWLSEPESLNNNWRGWKRQNGGQTSPGFQRQNGMIESVSSVANLPPKSLNTCTDILYEFNLGDTNLNLK